MHDGGDLSMMVNEFKIRDSQRAQPETVLVMQGGGSLGAYECGVYKALAKHDIKFDIIAGTSIGAINAGIIVGARGDEPARVLEDFWLSIADIKIPPFLPDSVRGMAASMSAAIYGIPRAFLPRWFMPSGIASLYFPFTIYKWPNLYDIKPLKKTLHEFIDFAKLNSKNTPRLIVTSTNIKESEPVSFDSAERMIDNDHLVASAGFPFYGISWTEKDGKFLWDGALLSNTPLREVIDASPKRDKNVYIVNLFPHKQDELPQNMADSCHRARDIMHTDRTDHNIRMSKVISKYLSLLREMHDILNNVELTHENRDRFFKVEREYHKLAEDRGAVIQEVTRVERKEELHFIFEDADFSLATIKNLIRQGEKDADNVLAKKGKNLEVQPSLA
jgi:NTE family protein